MTNYFQFRTKTRFTLKRSDATHLVVWSGVSTKRFFAAATTTTRERYHRAGRRLVVGRFKFATLNRNSHPAIVPPLCYVKATVLCRCLPSEPGKFFVISVAFLSVACIPTVHLEHAQ